MTSNQNSNENGQECYHILYVKLKWTHFITFPFNTLRLNNLENIITWMVLCKIMKLAYCH